MRGRPPIMPTHDTTRDLSTAIRILNSIELLLLLSEPLHVQVKASSARHSQEGGPEKMPHATAVRTTDHEPKSTHSGHGRVWIHMHVGGFAPSVASFSQPFLCLEKRHLVTYL
jgi:hypothetical protein